MTTKLRKQRLAAQGIMVEDIAPNPFDYESIAPNPDTPEEVERKYSMANRVEVTVRYTFELDKGQTLSQLDPKGHAYFEHGDLVVPSYDRYGQRMIKVIASEDDIVATETEMVEERPDA